MGTLSDAIIEQNISRIRHALQQEEINQLDQYGFTPLIEAAIVDSVPIAKLLLAHGANPNLQDVTGGTPLAWAAENNNATLCQLLLSHGANPNAYNFAGQPVLTMPTLRGQTALKKLMVKAGADLTFTQDYINTKLLGHLFELVGKSSIVSPQNQFVEVDFEGFFLEVTVGVIRDALAQFQNHFAARKLRKYSGLSQFIVEVLDRAAALIKYQQYRIDIREHQNKIDHLLREEPLIIPVGYEGHAITFLKYHDLWVKCDRREDSRLYDNIMFYRITKRERATKDFIKTLLYQKQSDRYINETLDDDLGLMPLTELKIEAQVSGNCSWANVEAAIPAMFFLVLMHESQAAPRYAYYKTLALNYFHRFREWNKDRALDICIQSFKSSDFMRKASKAEILAAILFQRCHISQGRDLQRMQQILSVLVKSPYEYLLKNYLRVYYYEGNTTEGRYFAEFLESYRQEND